MNLGLSDRYIPGRISVGVFFIVLAIVNAVCILPGAGKSQAPVLYVCLFGGLFVGVFGVLGIGIIIDQLQRRKEHSSGRRTY
jgi:hypothetical protein